MGPEIPLKKRRLRGACDICREKKVKCDSATMPGNICSNCVAFGSTCTHNLSKGKNKKSSTTTNEPSAASRTGQSMSHGLFDDYAVTRSKVAAILSASDVYPLPDTKVAVRQTLVELARYIHALELTLTSQVALVDNNSSSASPGLQPDLRLSVSNNTLSEEADGSEDKVLADHLKILSLNNCRSSFFGKSSNILMVKAAVDMHKRIFGEYSPLSLQAKEYKIDPPKATDHKRHPSELPTKWFSVLERAQPFVFPEDDLMHHLIELYFEHCNPFLPLFHKPTFDKLIADGVYLRNREFGAVLLSVCALASRYSDDPRVFDEDTKADTGLQWFSQVQPFIAPFMAIPNLYVIQLYCVCTLYLQGTSTPGACWLMCGIAMRLVLDLGIHRRSDEAKRTVESELLKRAFWGVIAVDTFVSASLGRPTSISPDDYDQDLPAECDDEYWETENPEHAFKQPPGKPSKLSYYLSFLKLLDIVAVAQRTIYTVRKSDIFNNQQSDHQVILRIDSALNGWMDSVPEHIRWDPHRKNQLFFDQSAVLYATYCHVQILVHKPFIPAGKPQRSNMAFPSVAICTNAARSCAHVMDLQSRRGFVPLPHIQTALLSSAVILMLNQWSGKRIGVPINPDKEYSDVYKCLELLRQYQTRWKVAGRSAKLLQQLLSIGDVQSNAGTRKHARQEDDEQATDLRQPKKTASLLSNAERLPTPDLERIFSLPFYTDELSRLPIHGSFDFSQDSWHQNHLQNTLPTPNEYGFSGTPDMPMNYPNNDQSAYPDMWDTGTMGLWSKAPHGYDWDTWASYLSRVEQSIQAETTDSL